MQLRFVILFLLLAAPPDTTASGSAERTRVVILGVSHAGQLFSREYRPAVLRAWLERVQPDAIGVERHPDAFARNDFYGFTYEIQDIVLPWSREKRVPVHPFDWEPDADDLELAFGFDIQRKPLLRPESGWGAFVSYDAAERANLALFLGEQPERRGEVTRWASTPVEHATGEMARRLFLFRTQMQAQRIRRAAERYRGGTFVVVVGAMHQPDLEVHLGRDVHIELVPASSFGLPTSQAVRVEDTTADLVAIAWANLFGAQSLLHQTDAGWLQEVLAALDGEIPVAEHRALSLRLDELTGRTASARAETMWLELAASTDEGARPSWTGIIQAGRIDSDFDPFARLDLRERALHEASRLTLARGDITEAQRLRDRVAERLSGPARLQYLGYWDRFVRDRGGNATESGG